MQIEGVRRGVGVAVGVALAASLMTACKASSDRPTVVTSFYPLYFIADRVAGKYNRVEDLTPPGVEPHEYELTVRQVADVDDADVGFYEHGMAPSIDQAMTNDAPAHALDVTSVVQLAAPVEDSGVESTSDDRDPHFWQDPTLMAQATTAFAQTMAKADPDHAAYYQRQGDRLVAELQQLNDDYARTLKQCRVDTLVVSHDAFEYLARRYHVDVVPIAGLEPDAEPSLSRLHDIAQLIRTHHVTTVFFETLASPALAESLAHDTGAKAAVLDPIEGLTSKDSTATYLTLMRQNLAAIAQAGDCS